MLRSVIFSALALLFFIQCASCAPISVRAPKSSSPKKSNDTTPDPDNTPDPDTSNSTTNSTTNSGGPHFLIYDDGVKGGFPSAKDLEGYTVYALSFLTTSGAQDQVYLFSYDKQ